MFQDLRLGIRMLLKNPGFSAVIVLTLALGIGVNVALFSVVNGVLLNPLPLPQPEQLVTISQSKPNFEAGSVPYPNFVDLRKENRTFSAMAISRGSVYSLLGAGEPERVNARQTSAELFSVLGLQPTLGRTFAAGEDEPGAAPVVMISSELWHRKFNSAQDVIGKALTLDEKSYTIIGVVPANIPLFRTVDVFVPIGQFESRALKSRSAALGLQGIGRLKPGVTVQQGEADLDRVMANLADAYPASNKGNGATVFSLKERIVGNIGSILWMLFGAVGFVLLIACVNVSNLLLARSNSRTREFAVRSALGASRWRLLRQALTESMLLALTGGTLGLIVAHWGTQAALAALPTTIPRAAEVGLDRRVLVFTVLVSLLTGILSGLAPALKTSQWRLSDTLKEGGRAVSGGRGRAQGVLVALEMALALVLLIGAGLMIRSLGALWNVDPGFRPDNVMTFGLSLSPSMSTAKPEQIRASLNDLSDRLSTTPGVKAVSFSDGGVPLQGADDLFFLIEGRPKPANTSEMPTALVYRVEPGYLAAMGIPLKRGRFFASQDNENSQPVAVIDEAFARKYFGDTDPIGKRILQGGEQPDQIIARQIIGVVGHVKQWSLDADDQHTLQAQLYEPFRQIDMGWSGLGVVIRPAEGTPLSFESIRSVVQNHNNQNVITKPQTMNEVIASSLADRRFAMILLDAFAVVALLLASLGLYGVISYLVGQRTHELGIRLALGAQSRDVLQLVLSHGMKMALGGVALGLLAAFGLTRLLSTMLFGVSATDPATFTVIAMVLMIVALFACFMPAHRATKVDPLVALRYE
ncbi:MAG TPA: ABC transporter permease [Pyrinomonadaceae bacterium]|nr:ABC transporter permease [Pyrinomonadaceae bacterium]